MPSYSVATIRRTLEVKLGAQPAVGGKHIFYSLYDGATFVAQTHVSHGARDIGDQLMNQMAKQLAIPNRFWIELYRCSHDRESYLARVAR